MKRPYFFLSMLLAVLFFLPLESLAWGFFGHRRINRMAVFTLPPAMVGFYKKHIEYVTAHAIDPDKRRYATKREAPRHYIDIDHYVEKGEDPFEVVPIYWKDAVEKFSEDTLQAYGIVPWHIQVMMFRLTNAFKERNADRILQLSAELGHYVSDAHVPLHTTENYNGQLTGQKGIHGLWESRIPELTAEDFDYLTGRAEYIDSPLEAAWAAVKASHSYLDSVLLIEKRLKETFPSDQQYAYEVRGKSTVRTYAQDYALAYDRSMGDMVEKRMRESVRIVGAMWYTAWVDAGQPDLSTFGNQEIQEPAVDEQLEKSFVKGEIKGRQHDQ